MLIIDLPDDETYIKQTALLLRAAFRENYPSSWVDMDSALAEVRESLAEDRISRIAVDKNDSVLGWIGGMSQYDGRVWELHPLAVDPKHQRQGIGRALVTDLEMLVAARGGLTLWLGTDDVTGQTSLSDVDLYNNLWQHVAHIENRRGHPYTFYQKCGFIIAGIVPDANGPGKPDILMAKQVKRANDGTPHPGFLSG